MPRHYKNRFFTNQGKLIIILVLVSFASILGYYMIDDPDKQEVGNQIINNANNLPEKTDAVTKNYSLR